VLVAGISLQSVKMPESKH